MAAVNWKREKRKGLGGQFATSSFNAGNLGRKNIYICNSCTERGQRRMMLVKVACVDSNKSIFPSQQTYLAKTDV